MGEIDGTPLIGIQGFARRQQSLEPGWVHEDVVVGRFWITHLPQAGVKPRICCATAGATKAGCLIHA